MARTTASNRVAARFMGGSTYFNGSTAYSLQTVIPGLSAGVTFACWVKVVSYSSPIITHTEASTSRFSLYVDPSGKLCFGFYNGSSWVSVKSTTEAIPKNRWLYVVATYDGATAHLFLNGVEQSGTTTPGDSAASTVRFAFGARTSLATEFLKGNIAEVVVLTRAITTEERNNLYQFGTIPADTAYFWKLDDQPSTYIDTIGGNNGTGTATAYSTDVPVQDRVAVRDMGTALRFASGNYVNRSNVGTLSTTSLSFAATFLVTNAGASYPHVMEVGGSDSACFFLTPSTKVLVLKFANIGGSGVSVNLPALTLGKWYSIVGVYDGQYIRAYVNGVQVARAAKTGAITYTDASTFVAAGGTGSTPSGNYMIGLVESARVWNTALTSQEVSAMYFNNIVPRDGLVVEYLFDEGSGTTALDSSGNGNNGTISGATRVTNLSELGAISRRAVVPYVGSIVFPGANAFVDTWYDVIGTGDRTVRATFMAKGGGENSAGRIFDNGKFIVYVDANRAIKVSSDGLTTTGTTPNGVVKWNRWHDLVIERAANGTADIYLDGILVASGQNTGTPAVGNHSYAVTLESFENVSDWTPGGVGGSVTEDTTYFKDGTKSFKIVAPAGDGYFATRVISQNFSNTDTFAFWVYIPTQTDLDNLFSLGIYLTAQSNFSTYFLANPSAQYHLGWNKILLHKNDFTASGGASWSSTMIRLRVRANAGAGGPATVYVDKLEGDTRTKPKVLITFDDGWETQYTNAFLYMNTLGLRGTNYVIGSKANQSMYLTTEQIREMYDADWDIATHGFTNLTTMSLAEAETDVNTERQWIIDNGFTRREAYNHYAYPNGGYNQDLMDMLEDNNFVSGRTIVEKTQPEEIDEPFALTRRSIINTTSIAAAKAYIDKLILTGGALLLNFHRIVETPVYDTEWSIDNFEELMDYIKSKVDTASVENIVISELVPGLPDSLLIGDNFASNRCFNGYIAGARVYENDLSTEEVEQLYLTNATLYDNNPSVCVLNLETLAGRISGTTWTDVSGNEKHGTLSGATLVEGVAPSKVRTSV